MAKMSKETFEKYVDTLDSVSKTRYLQKLSAVGGVDPYQHTEWSDEAKCLPNIEQADISDYLVHRTSFYTREKFKADKSLGAHNQLTAGWVQRPIQTYRPQGCQNTVITAQVYHSQSLTDKLLRPWVIAEPDGNIITAHCTCMAGLGETCSHVAALLFSVDVAVRLRDSKTPTQFPAGWVVPSAKEGIYSESNKIDFTSAQTKRRQMEATIDGTSSTSRSKRKRVEAPVPTRTEMEELYKSMQLSKTGVRPAILSVIPGYQEDYKPSPQQLLPVILSTVYNESLRDKHYQEILDYCATVDVSVTQEQAVYAEQQSRGQSSSKTWLNLRAGRVTASTAHQVCHTNPAQPSLSLIYSITNTCVRKPQTAAMKWGITHEEDARREYKKLMVEQHEEFTVLPCGFFINPLFPYIGASPDGMSFCKCHGRGCFEIKCPAFKSSNTILESCDDPSFCLQNTDGKIMLKRSLSYYSQVQTQIFVTEAEYCDFIVWTPKDIFIERVFPDAERWDEMLPKMEHFFRVAVLPEVVAHSFSQPRPQPLQNSPSKANTQAAGRSHYCYCNRGEEEDDMVACDNVNCKMQWFHFFCVGIKTTPKGRWYCPDCRQLPEFRLKGKSRPKMK